MNIFKTIKNATKAAARKTGAACRVIRNEFVAGYNATSKAVVAGYKATSEAVVVSVKAVASVPGKVWTCTKETTLAIKEHWTEVFRVVLFDAGGIGERSLILAKEIGIGVKTVVMVPVKTLLKWDRAVIAWLHKGITKVLSGAMAVVAFLVESVCFTLGLAFFTGYAAGEWTAVKLSSSLGNWRKQSEPSLATAA